MRCTAASLKNRMTVNTLEGQSLKFTLDYGESGLSSARIFVNSAEVANLQALTLGP